MIAANQPLHISLLPSFVMQVYVLHNKNSPVHVHVALVNVIDVPIAEWDQGNAVQRLIPPKMSAVGFFMLLFSSRYN